MHGSAAVQSDRATLAGQRRDMTDRLTSKGRGRGETAPERKAARRRERPKAKGRGRAAEIMDVALDLYAEKDYTAVTVTEIAARIGVRHSLIYYYFKNKEELFRKTVQSQIRKTLANYESLVAQHDHPVDLIEDWFDNNIQLSTPLRKLTKIMFDYSSPRSRSPSLGRAIKRFYDTERNIIASSIEKGIELGIFRPVDAQAVSSFVSTHIDGIFFSSLMRRDVDLEDDMEELKRVLWMILDCDDRARRRSAKLGKRI